MPTYKVSFIFNSANAGWTETFYRNRPTARDAALTTVFQKNAVVGLRHPLTKWMSTRAVNVADPRDQYLDPVGINGTAPSPGPGGDFASDAPTLSLRLLLQTSAGVKRFMWARGLRDSMTHRENDGSYNLASLLGPANAYIAALIGMGAQIRTQRQDVAPAKRLVASLIPVDLNAPQAGTRVNHLAPAVPAGALISFGRVPCELCNFPRLTRPTDETPAPTWFTIPYTMKFLGATPVAYSPPGGMYFRVLTDFNYPTITSGRPITVSSHDTGRPTGLLRGRQSAGCRRQ